MSDNDTAQRIGQLKGIKSAFLLEARSLDAQGLTFYALPFFRRAADIELELAGMFRALGRENDARVSLLSAASSLAQAKQFRTAVPILEQVADVFPEARDMLADCRGKEDQPLVAETPALQALVGLLVKKGLISDGEWAEALQAM